VLKLCFNDPDEFLAEATAAPPGTTFRVTIRARTGGNPVLVGYSVLCTALVTTRYWISGEGLSERTEGEFYPGNAITLLQLETFCGQAWHGEAKSEQAAKANATRQRLEEALGRKGYTVRAGVLEV
jgi:hypothetical protein